MSYLEERKNYPELIPKKSQTAIGIVGGDYLYCDNARYLIMQDDLDYARIQSINLEAKKREAYLTDCKINGKIVVKAKLKSVWNEKN